MDQKTKKNFSIFVVSIVIAGMVFSFVPFLFQTNPRPVDSGFGNETASVVPLTPPANSDPAPTSSRKSSAPAGFDGLEKEKESFDDLNDLLQ
ncbi:MAG: hypothetical protein AAB617_02050 [Patescibacteria group bacterium]